MKSKTSFFNKTLFLKNIKRFWPLWGLETFFACIIPALIWVDIMQKEPGHRIINGYEMNNAYVDFAKHGAPIVAAVTAIIAAMSVWNYLYNTKSVSAMHSYPISRKGLFCTNYISGLTMMLIPYVVAGFFTILETLLLGGGIPVGTLALIATVVLESIFFFSFASLIAQICGNIVALPIMYGVFSFLQIAIESLLSKIYVSFNYGLTTSYGDKFLFLTPLVYLYKKVFVLNDISKVHINTDYCDYYSYGYREIYEKYIGNFGVIAIYGAVGIALAIVAYLLYKVRKSESAGDTIAFKYVKPVIETAFTILVGGGLGLLLYFIFGDDYEFFNAKILFICMLVAVLIAFVIGRMLVEKTIKIFNGKTFIGMAAVSLATAFFVLACRFDVFGAAKYVPDSSAIDSVSISLNGAMIPLYKGEDDELIEDVRALHQKFIDEGEMIERINVYDGDYYYCNFSLTYYEGGKKTVREYPFKVHVNEGDDTEFEKDLIEFFSDKKLNLKGLENDSKRKLISFDCDVQYYLEELKDFGATPEMAQIVLEGFKKDIEEGRYCMINQYMYRYNYTWLEFCFEYDRQEMGEPGYDWRNYEITTKMTNTLQALSKVYGISYEDLLAALEGNPKFSEDEFVVYDF